MRPTFQVPATFDAANRKKDKSVGYRFTSNFEITTADFMLMDAALHQSGWLLWAPNELQDEDVPAEPAHGPEGKPKGQRMRAVWFLIWKKRGIEEPFETWYDRNFERLLDHWKEELD